MKNILLIDTCYLINAVLSRNNDIRLIDEFYDQKTTGKRVTNDSIDIVILDISIPKNNGLETVIVLKQLRHKVPILILGGEEQAEYATNFLKLGCNGYLTKHCNETQLINAINSVTSGEICIIPADFKSAVESTFNQSKVLDGLSRREIQVLLKIARGQSIEAIASELNITPSTTSVFKSNIMRKMNFKNNVDIIHYALNHHLVELPLDESSIKKRLPQTKTIPDSLIYQSVRT